MRFFIGNLIRGEAAEFYKTTCADLSSRFAVENVSEIVPPHITVKAPFEKNSPEMIDDTIALITETPAIPIKLSGWNHFTTRTIFLDVPDPVPELKQYIKSVIEKLNTLGLEVNPKEQDPHLHMSVARFLKPFQYDKVWEYLNSTPTPEFDINFDNLTIFVKEKRDDKAWKVFKTFPLTGIKK